MIECPEYKHKYYCKSIEIAWMLLAYQSCGQSSTIMYLGDETKMGGSTTLASLLQTNDSWPPR